MAVPHHPSGLNEKVVAKVVALRGRMHAHERLEPAKTALVVIDLTRGAVALENGCRMIVPPINAIAGALRRAGGHVAWVTTAADAAIDPHLVATAGAERARLFHDMARTDDPRSRLWHELDARETDIRVTKRRFSAFFPGKCDLPDLLQARGVDTVLIAGTVTNVCCESAARDAVELGYRVVMVSDALAGHAHGLSEASLTTIFRIFGDVRPAGEILALVDAGAAESGGRAVATRGDTDHSAMEATRSDCSEIVTP